MKGRSILLDLLPESFIINNKEYPIYSDFRTTILFEIAMIEFQNDIAKGKSVDVLGYSIDVIKLFIKGAEVDGVEDENLVLDILEYNNEFREQVMEFYTCGKIDEEETDKETKVEEYRNEIYCWEYDAELIYAAFLDQYGIDLQDIEGLHWWKFMAMFTGLKSDNKIVEIMGYRALDLSKLHKDQRRYYSELKQRYAIPDGRTKEEKQASFNKQLSQMFR